MSDKFNKIPGGITAAAGFSAGAAWAGINRHSRFNLDVCLMKSDRPCQVAGVFTRNKFQSAHIIWCRGRMADSQVKGLVVNSGCANAGTGKEGLDDTRLMAGMAAGQVGLTATEMMVASTGVIGRRLPLDLLAVGIKNVCLSPEGGSAFARAIMTTDSVPKEAAVNTGSYTIGGTAKGAGMIHPDMATMLGFITTDAIVDGAYLQQALEQAVDSTFNMISVDGDTSPNDTVLLFANGAAGNPRILPGTPAAEVFQEALESVCRDLAKAIAADGEGATRLIEARVSGARSLADARLAARTVIGSSLVKTAVHGCDPNWGRIIAAAGRSGAALREGLLELTIGGTRVFSAGQPLDFDPGVVSAHLGQKTVILELNLNLGQFEAVAWGCDLSAEYVAINADYTT
jgi:glutamate N-acetyltransferase/amino-acid N-acetyltransferase